MAALMRAVKIIRYPKGFCLFDSFLFIDMSTGITGLCCYFFTSKFCMKMFNFSWKDFCLHGEVDEFVKKMFYIGSVHT